MPLPLLFGNDKDDDSQDRDTPKSNKDGKKNDDNDDEESFQSQKEEQERLNHAQQLIFHQKLLLYKDDDDNDSIESDDSMNHHPKDDDVRKVSPTASLPKVPSFIKDVLTDASKEEWKMDSATGTASASAVVGSSTSSNTSDLLPKDNNNQQPLDKTTTPEDPPPDKTTTLPFWNRDSSHLDSSHQDEDPDDFPLPKHPLQHPPPDEKKTPFTTSTNPTTTTNPQNGCPPPPPPPSLAIGAFRVQPGNHPPVQPSAMNSQSTTITLPRSTDDTNTTTTTTTTTTTANHPLSNNNNHHHNNYENHHHRPETSLGGGNPPNNSGMIEAIAMPSEELEHEILEKIIQNSTQATMVLNVEKQEREDEERKKRKKGQEQTKRWQRRVMLGFLLLFLFMVITLTIVIRVQKQQQRRQQDNNGEQDNDDKGSSSSFSTAPSTSPTQMPLPTLERIRYEGTLRCGVLDSSTFSDMLGNTNDQLANPETDICTGIAAAIFGSEGVSQNNLIIIPIKDAIDKFELLANGTVDVLAASVGITMELDVYHSRSETGFSFSIPYFYGGVQFSGLPEFVECASDDLKNFGEPCESIQICSVAGSAHLDALYQRLPSTQIVVVPNFEALYLSFMNGTCNLIANEGIHLSDIFLRELGYGGEYDISKHLFTKKPIALVTREEDPTWSDFVNWVLLIFLRAEQQKLTQSSMIHPTLYQQQQQQPFFGTDYPTMLVNVIGAVGNYGEIYNRHLQWLPPRQPMNFINDGSTGLIYSHPFGETNRIGPDPTPGGTLEQILQRKTLRCAIRVNRTGFAEKTMLSLQNTTTTPLPAAGQDTPTQAFTYTGIDVDFCRAVSASIFGFADKGFIQFVESNSHQDSFYLLSNGTVDLVAGSVWNFENDIYEPNTGQGYSFSQPYFYFHHVDDSVAVNKKEDNKKTDNKKVRVSNDDLVNRDDNLCLMTRQDDPQWSSFVYWIVTSLFYAEEMDISQRRPNNMPLVNLFGNHFIRMFRDAILSTGNYGDIYERNVEHIIPRSRRNRLNINLYPKPQHYPLLVA